MRKGITRVKAPGDLTAMFPFIMKRRCDSQVYYKISLNAEPLLAKIDERQDVTFFQALILALVKTMRDRPHLNRFVMGRRLYQREDIDVCFMTRGAASDESLETHAKIRVAPESKDGEIVEAMEHRIREAREGGAKKADATISSLAKLPRFLLRALVSCLYWTDFHARFPKSLEEIDPLHCSVYVSNLGTMGIDAPYHHLYEWGTCSIVAAVGTITPKIVLDAENTPALRKTVEIKVSLDDRIAEGYYFARALETFKNYVEHPETLFPEPVKLPEEFEELEGPEQTGPDRKPVESGQPVKPTQPDPDEHQEQLMQNGELQSFHVEPPQFERF